MTKRLFPLQSYRRYQRLCNLLAQAREDAGLTQVELSRRLKRPQSFVSKYETRQRRLDVIELIDIAAALSLDLVAIIKDLQSFPVNDEQRPRP